MSRRGYDGNFRVCEIHGRGTCYNRCYINSEVILPVYATHETMNDKRLRRVLHGRYKHSIV